MTIEMLAQELQAAQQEVADSLTGATEPELHTAPEPGEWTASEVAAHVIEMQAMWMEKIANAGEEPDLARSHSEIDRRTASVEAHSGDDIATVTRARRVVRADAGDTAGDVIVRSRTSGDLWAQRGVGHGARGCPVAGRRTPLGARAADHGDEAGRRRQVSGSRSLAMCGRFWAIAV